MSMTGFREQLIAPIMVDNPVGERLRDDPQLNFIDSQMMKVGSLSHGEVQWEEVENNVISLLSTKTKDIKLLTVLMQCLQHKATPERFTLSIGVLVDFISHFWFECQPIPGERGAVHRKKFFNQICQRTYVAADKLDSALFDIELKAKLETLLQELCIQAEELILSVDVVNDISARLRHKLAQVSSISKVETPKASVTSAVDSSNSNNVTAAVSAVPMPNLDIDSGSERSFKMSLLKAVDCLSELGCDGVMLSLRIRRFAMWYSIHSLPDANVNGETQLMPVSLDRISDYEEGLQRGADIELWRRVEESLTKAPYWLDGHFLSYRIAIALGQDMWAEIIKDELQRFIQRLPALKTCSFKGLVPFISEVGLKWLDSSVGNVKVDEAVQMGSWNEKRDEALALALEEGIAPSLKMLNDGLSQATEPRDAFYWRLLSADVMKKNALPAMASEQYQTLYRQVNEMSVTEWEPSLIEQIKNNIAAE
ncbi:type VI secretion system protein TssA [Photobacterium phosphoreum]|uniref:type VI secretion system protein TssA n=1 Tax=Photobacterium phosphoreum TaxID=659 RepID=UPI000D175C39|nr:type VI secretion system protein TssA [Photobacterium phosphoreum]PSW27933.1 type VI secretion system protein TssA [Photobacterium phosphoreum]